MQVRYFELHGFGFQIHFELLIQHDNYIRLLLVPKLTEVSKIDAITFSMHNTDNIFPWSIVRYSINIMLNK